MDIIAIILSVYVLKELIQLQKRVLDLEKHLPFKGSATEQIMDVDKPVLPIAKPYDYSDLAYRDGQNQLSEIQADSNDVSDESSSFVNWVREDFMVKLGGLLLLIALGWFVSYAFANNWIGPVGRITLGLLFGVFMMVLGVWRIKDFKHQGGVFTVLGSTTVLLTVFAAREMYDLFTPISALFVMFMSIALVAFMSVRYSLERLAIIGLILAAFAPQLTAAPLWDPVVILPYLLVVVAGTLWVVWFTGWTKLTLISLIVTYIYSTSFSGVHNLDLILTFSFLFVLLFFVANVVSLVRRREDDKHLSIHAITALGTALFLFTWIEGAAVEEWKSLLYSAWALVFVFGTYVTFRFTANYLAFYLYGATSIALVGLATAAELQGSALVIAFIAEITMLIIATTKITNQIKLPAYQTLLYFIPGFLSIQNIYNWSEYIFYEEYYGIFHIDFVVLVSMIIVLGLMAVVIRVRRSDQDSSLIKFISGLLYFGFGFYTIVLVWLTTHSLFLDGLAVLVSLVIYTLVGITLFTYGQKQNSASIKMVGASLIGISLFILFTLVVTLSDVFKIIIFFVIGAMLISTAFMRKKYKDEINLQ